MAKKTGTFKSPGGQTVTVRGDWVEDFGINSWEALQRALKQGVGGPQGINATINGVEYNLTNQAGNQGFRSEGQFGIGGGITGVPTAGFLEDHNTLEGVLGAGKGLANAALGVGPIVGAGLLSGGLGSLGGAGAAEAGAAPTVGGAGGVVNAGQYGLPGAAGGAAGAAGGATGGAGALATGGVGAGAGAGAGTVGGLLSGAGSLIPGIPNNVLGGAIQGVGGYLAADAQGDAYQNVATQNLGLGQWARDQYKQTYNDPNYLDRYQPFFDRAADISARSWSAKAGNPAGNPTAQAGILSDVWFGAMLPTLFNDRQTLSNAGNWGLGTAGNAQLMGAGTTGSGWEAIGAGIGTALNPQPDWNQIFKQYGLGGNQPNYALNIGGVRQS